MSRNGPFGLCMGMTLDQVGGEPEEVAPAKYRALSVPKPHSAFETYILQITPQHGLSWIKAIGCTIQTSVHGAQLQAEFDSLEERLSAIYGKFKRTDFLMTGSIWNEPQDWMDSLLNKERFLMTAWSPKHGSTLANSVVQVALIAIALDRSTGYIAVEYSFENADAADKELLAAEDEAL